MIIISRIVWSILPSLMLLSGLQAFRTCNVPRLNTNLMNVMRLHKSRRGMPLMFSNNFPKAFARSQHFLFSSETDKTRVGDKETSSTVKDGFKTLWKKYGYVAIGTYLSIYVVTLSSIFMSLDFDLFNAATFGFDPNAAVFKVISLFVQPFRLQTYFLFKVCDLFETVTGSKALPAYIKENPRGRLTENTPLPTLPHCFICLSRNICHSVGHDEIYRTHSIRCYSRDCSQDFSYVTDARNRREIGMKAPLIFAE